MAANFKTSTKRTGLALAAASMFLAGCVPQTEESDSAGSPAAPAATPTRVERPDPAPGPGDSPIPASREEEARPATATPAAVPENSVWGGVLVNSSFEEWSAGRPAGWTMSTNWGRLSEDAHSGKGAVELLDVGESYSKVIQVAIDGQNLAGKKVLASAQVKAEDTGKAIVQLSYTVNGEEIRFNKSHPGDGKWHNVGTTRPIPEDADPDSIKIMIFRRPGCTGTVLVDSTTLRTVD